MVMKADSIQVALFPRPGTPQPDALQIWNSACKDYSPDGFQRGNNTPMAVSYSFGTIKDHNVRIQSQLGRVDIFIMALQNGENNFPPTQIADTIKALAILFDVSSLALRMVKPVRVGLVGNMTEFADDMAGVIDRLKSEIGSVSFPDNTTDHIYQYNLPKKNAEEVRTLNRIFTFGSGLLQEFSGTIGMVGSNVSVVRERPVMTLKVDINSLPNQDVTNVASDMLAEQFMEMDRVARKGVKDLA